MDQQTPWGSGITYFGSTTLKEQLVRFGIKDRDRVENMCVMGRADSGRGDLLMTMMLQDIQKGCGAVLLDADGKMVQRLLERLDPAVHDKLVYLDPSDAEYPYTWNILDDVKSLPPKGRLDFYIHLLETLYGITRDAFVEDVARMVLEKEGASVYSFYALITDEKFRRDFFDSPEQKKEETEKKKKDFEDRLIVHGAFAKKLEEDGKYIAKDTMVRNLIGQKQSKFTLDHLPDGQIVVVDFSRIRMYPTRMKPLLQMFIEAVEISASAEQPSLLYMQDCARYLDTDELQHLFQDKRIAVTVGDTIIQEADFEKRKYMFSLCGTIVSLATHPLDKELVEHVFYPHTTSDELQHLEKNEMLVALSIDGVRQKPFFAHTTPLLPKQNTSFQDMVVAARDRYTTARSKVDASLKPKPEPEPDDENDPLGGASFQDAFRSIFAKKAGDDKAGAGSTKEPAKKETPINKEESAEKKVGTLPADNQEKKEVPETMLKEMVFVPVPA